MGIANLEEPIELLAFVNRAYRPHLGWITFLDEKKRDGRCLRDQAAFTGFRDKKASRKI
jgi:hypothetical protein